MRTLFFEFSKRLTEVEVNTKLRVSLWLEKNSSYLMPCEFKEVLKENDLYKIKINVLDPQGRLSADFLNEKFLFGHPGKIIGYGILKGIES